jgi:hypothetical protein
VYGVVVVHVVVLLQFEFHLTDQTLPRELEINLLMSVIVALINKTIS